MAETYEQMMMNQSAANSAFNASEAEINRTWNEVMSNTAHQREVKDLIAAGLNPVLSANSGASWSSVANATADPSSAAGLASLAIAKMNTAAQIEMSKISAQATKAAAGATAAATMYAANQSASAARYSADQSNEAQKYSSSHGSWAGTANRLLDALAGNPDAYIGMV